MQLRHLRVSDWLRTDSGSVTDSVFSKVLLY